MKKFLLRIKQLFFRDNIPEMIWGFRRNDGTVLNNVRISNTTFIGCREKLMLSDHIFVGHFNFIDSCNGITIEEGCQISNYVSILTHSSHIPIRLYGNHYMKYSDHIGYLKGTVTIGKFTFIGPHTVIMPGTKLGKGTLVSAYSYVHGEYPDFAILSGNPAKMSGDTRSLDQKFLDQHPELQVFYDEWSKDQK